MVFRVLFFTPKLPHNPNFLEFSLGAVLATASEAKSRLVPAQSVLTLIVYELYCLYFLRL